MKTHLFLFTLLIITGVSQIQSQVIATEFPAFEKRVFTVGENQLQYRVLYPLNYDPSKLYPVITFLHGSGERGSDNEAQLKHGGSFFYNDTTRRLFPAIVIFPQLPKQNMWAQLGRKKDSSNTYGFSIDFSQVFPPTVSALLVKQLLDSLISHKLADPARMYIGGLSLGGFGTFNMVERYPDFFAAAFPICGGGNTGMAKQVASKTSFWIFHGDVDKSVDVKFSREYYAALKNEKADVLYTEYPGIGHNSWDNAFAEKELMSWIFSKKKR